MFIPIKIKIRTAVLIVALLFTFFTFFYFPKQENDYLLKAYNSEVQNLANSVALGVKIALNEDNYEGVETAMQYVKGKPDLLYVSLLQADTVWNDTHTAYSIKQKIFKTFPDSVDATEQQNSSDSAIIKYAPFETQLMSGAVALVFSTNEIKESIKSIRIASLMVSASIMLLGLLISVWLSRNISRPVEALSKAAKKVGQGDLTPVAVTHSNDELGMLTNVFNNMVADLSKTQQQLKNTNAVLSDTNKTLSSTLNNLKDAQAQLVQSEKMASLGELTAGIAHEIQNPLNFVNNFSELNNELIDEMNLENDIKEIKAIANDVKLNNEKIAFHGKRADAIVKNMLQHSRQSKGVMEPTDINALCDEYVRLAYHGMRAKDKGFEANFKTNFDESIGKINIVPQDIRRVLLNLFNNAFYAVNEKKKSYELSAMRFEALVSVQTKKLNDRVEVIVKDNGNGIPQNIIDKIFQPFFTTKPTGQGTGLGLSLSYDIIKAHGGEINVKTKEGEGSEFIVQLPIV